MRSIGKLRSMVRELLAEQLAKIDRLVEPLLQASQMKRSSSLPCTRRIVCLISLIAPCLLLVLLASCAAEPGATAATPTESASPAATALPVDTPVLSTSEGAAPSPTPTSPPDPSPTVTQRPPPTPDWVTHTVQTGDTLLGLATEYGVPMAAIQLHNQIGDSTVVKIGQTLSIPPQVGWEGASPFWAVHVVEEGETLISIARAYDLEVDALQAVNGLSDADVIRIGQNLVLPLETFGAAPELTDMPVLSAGEEPISSTPVPTAVPAAVPPADVAAWPRETVRLINQVRAQHGLGPLTYNETLAQAAQAHANDCAQRGWCSHTGSDGANIEARIRRAGYEPAGWAECWAQNQSPQEAVEAWMDEVPPNDAHRRTLLTTWLSEIGVGVAKAKWGYYFIADFGRP